MIASRSEAGSYRYDGDADMKVLRSRAKVAVEYFRTRDEGLKTDIFGCPVSVIEDGRLVDRSRKNLVNAISRHLDYGTSGCYAGRMTLSYNDTYNDGRGTGGYASTIIDDVRDVRIDGDYLVIEGMNGNPKPNTRVAYRYRIQDAPDSKPFVRPIPKGGSVPPAKPSGTAGASEEAPAEPIARKPEPKPVPKTEQACDVPSDYAGPRMTRDQIVSAFAEPVRCRFLNKGWTVWLSMKHCQNPRSWVDAEVYRLVKGERRYGMGSFGPDQIESDGRYVRLVEGRNVLWYRIDEALKTAPADRPEPKPVPKKAPSKPVKAKRTGSVSEPPKAPSKPVKAKETAKKGTLVYEVRVDGRAVGEFSSKSKAETLKKQLKTSGEKARIYAVFA